MTAAGDKKAVDNGTTEAVAAEPEHKNGKEENGHHAAEAEVTNGKRIF